MVAKLEDVEVWKGEVPVNERETAVFLTHIGITDQLLREGFDFGCLRPAALARILPVMRRRFPWSWDERQVRVEPHGNPVYDPDRRAWLYGYRVSIGYCDLAAALLADIDRDLNRVSQEYTSSQK